MFKKKKKKSNGLLLIFLRRQIVNHERFTGTHGENVGMMGVIQ